MDRYRVYTNTGLLGGDHTTPDKDLHRFYLNQATWHQECNDLIADGWIPLGGIVHFGGSGLMQTMYKPKEK